MPLHLPYHYRTDELYGVQRRTRLLRNQPIQRHNRTNMNTSQLQCIISCDPVLRERVLGVFAADQLPTAVPYIPCGFIANTDIKSQSGTHWLAFFIENNTVDCFDSYGQHPGVYNALFSAWMQNQSLNVRVNQTRLQSDTSSVCGLYCVYFLRQRLLGHSMKCIIERFNVTDFEANDRYIFDMFSDIYSHCVHNVIRHVSRCYRL